MRAALTAAGYVVDAQADGEEGWYLGDTEAYGAAIARELEDTAERSVSIGALYATLARLADKGYVVHHESAPLPVQGGRARKHYTLTGAGEAAEPELTLTNR